MQEILVSPMSLVGMTTYHTKNLPNNAGASYGLLYALQQELTYNIALTAPLGTHDTEPQVLLARAIEYETLRLRKSKNNLNYYEEYVMIGYYIMASEKFMNKRTALELDTAFAERGAPYSLTYLVSEETVEPKLLKGGKPVRYRFQIDPLQKYCADALNMQSNKKESVFAATLKKEKHLVETYNSKLERLIMLLDKTTDPEKRRQAQQLLESYERMQTITQPQKLSQIEAINYSVLTGLILTHQQDLK